jgi:hypothetical protein
MQLEPRTRKSLVDLPEHVCEQIIRHASFQNEGHKIVDLDNCTALMHPLGPCAINRYWRTRHSHKCLYSPEIRYMFTMSSTTQAASFNQLSHLHRLLHTKFDTETSLADGQEVFGVMITGTISIRFNLGENLTLQDIRIDVVPIIEATLIAAGSWQVAVNITCSGTGGATHEFATTLSQIRRDALKAWPPVKETSEEKFPEIRVNGLFQAVKVGGDRVEDLGQGVDDESAGDQECFGAPPMSGRSVFLPDPPTSLVGLKVSLIDSWNDLGWRSGSSGSGLTKSGSAG